MEYSVHLIESTDSQATVELHAVSGDVPPGLTGSLVGPFCTATRTLTTEFAVRLTPRSSSYVVSVQVTDPCYWRPSLPFLYRLKMSWQENGSYKTAEQDIGFRRLRPFRTHLFWDDERIVLRGAAVEAANLPALNAAKDARATLLAQRPTVADCVAADSHGVTLIADLRDSLIDLDDVQRLSSHASVAMVLIDAHQIMPCDLNRFTPQSMIGVALYPDDIPRSTGPIIPSWCQAIVVELEDKPMPPAASSSWQKPVIAIRRGVAYADLHEARAACDQLQADLAPEFNLAGYFVAP